MRRSKDHRSARAVVVTAPEWWWPWQTSGVFSALVMISVSVGGAVDQSVMQSTATTLASSFSSSPSLPITAGAIADCFCGWVWLWTTGQSAVDHWVATGGSSSLTQFRRGVGGGSVPAPPSSVSGEAEDPQEGFAFPLIDPWYTSSPLFPPRSVDFAFPAEDWDWTVSGLEPTVDQAWVLNLDEISELLIQKEDLQATPINFDFLCAASKDWSHWVDHEILDPDFWDRLVDAGVHWSILISRSCNMFRDTESLQDVANHWMLPILGEHSFADIKLSAEKEEVIAALRKRASTRLSGWPTHFSQLDGAAIRRAAFVLYWLCKCTFGNFPCYSINTAFIPLAIRISAGHCFPIAPLFLGHLYSQLDLLHDYEIQGDSCYILSAVFNTSVLQTFFWEHSDSYVFAARDRSAGWGLKTHDHDLVDALDYEENVLFRPYGDDHPGFTCASIFRKFYGPSPMIRDLKVDDFRSLSYLSTVSPGFLPVLSATGVYFIPYCPQRVQRQFGLDQGIPVGPQETSTCVADLTAFLKSRAFARWGGEATRVLIPGGHRLGFNTPSMGAYWQRFTQSMVDFAIAGRSDKTPMSVHRKAPVSNPYLTPPSQSAISYANSQKLGFAEWDTSRGGWITYTIHLPEGWRSSINVVEDRLIMLSKRGKVNKRDAPVDPAIEKTPKKETPSVSSSKKVSSKKAKSVKKSKPSLLVPSAAKESTAALVQESAKSATAPPKRKTRAGKESKSTPSVPSAVEESTATPLEEPAESTESPPKKAKAGKKSKSTAPVASAVKGSTTAPVKGPTESTVAPSKPKSAGASSPQQSSKKSAASRPPKSQKKVDVSSSSPDEEEPSAVPAPSPPKKKFTGPLFPLGAAGRTRSKSGPKVTHGSGRSGGGVVDVEDSDVADDDVIASPVRKDAPQAAAVDQDEDLGKSTAGSSEAGDESMGEEHSSSSASFFDSTPSSLPEDQVVSAGSTADDDNMPEADDSSMEAAGSMEEDLAIVPHGGHDDDSFDVSMAHVMEGVSLFGVTPSLRAVPAGGFVIPASRLSSEDSPVVGGAVMPKETHAQDLVESGSVVDLGVDATGHDAPIEDAGISVVDTLAGSDHLENIGVDDAMHVSEEIDEVGITGEVTAISPPRRPTVEVGSSVGVGGLSSEVAAFFREFDTRAPNPHPEQFFWSFNGPLVPFGDFWVPNDCSPYLSRLSAGHSDFTKGFKLSIGLGGPMMSLLGSVLAAMDESSLEDVTKTQILAWRSVIQDLMDVGFDLGFMMERLRQMAQRLFGKRLADEIKALQHQIAPSTGFLG
uniref:Aminotransferase-like plant mobile domain-containing protein n=1 Tax=Fagus sylvatica TaxID=28930 RepID=A0A2N9F3G1_FAGSY